MLVLEEEEDAEEIFKNPEMTGYGGIRRRCLMPNPLFLSAN